MRKAYVNLSYILAARWFMYRPAAESFYPAVFNLIQGKKAWDDEDEEPREKKNSKQLNDPTAYFVSDQGHACPPENAPENSVAIISLQGAITKYDYCGSAGTLTKLSLLQRCMRNSNIIGVVLDMDSGGGDGSATQLLASAIYNAPKPVVGFVQGMAASACYWIGSACKEIVIDSKTTELGSIGAYVPMTDFTKYWEKLGIKDWRIYAPQSKLKNKPIEDALKGDESAMKEDLEKYVDFFIRDVQLYRGSRLGSDPRIMQGAMFYCDEAISLGLADHEGDLAFAISRVRDLAESTDPDNTSSTNSTNFNMKVSFKSAWTAVLALFGLAATAGQENIEHEVTQADWEKLNSRLAEVDSLKTQVSDLTKDKDAAIAAKNTAETSLASEKTAHAETRKELDDLKNKTTAEEKKQGADPGGDNFGKSADEEFLTPTDREAARIRERSGGTNK